MIITLGKNVFHKSNNVIKEQCCVSRYYQSTKSSGLSSNLQPTGAKADHLREEMEEAANRMEICRVSDHLHNKPAVCFRNAVDYVLLSVRC